MNRLIFFLSIMAVLYSCGQNSGEKIIYPVTKKVDVADTLFGTIVHDPYRWLENDMSNETAEWIKEQNTVTYGYLDRIPYRGLLRQKLTGIWNYEKFTIPSKEGDYTYYSRNDGLQNQYVIYRQKDGEEPEVFLDPNTFSPDGTTSLAEIGFSEDGNLVAYSISEGGSDWRKIIIKDAISGEITGDTINDVKFSGITWKSNEGFYYSSYDKPDGSELSAMTDHHKLYYHRIGTKQADDKVIFGADIKRRYVSGNVTEDGKYLIVNASVSTTGNELYIKDLTKESSGFKVIAGNFENDHFVIGNEGSRLFIYTNLGAPNGKIVTVDAGNPDIRNFVDLIPETGNALDPSAGCGFIFANYLVDAISTVRQYDLKGRLIREISLPGKGYVSGFSSKMKDTELYFSFTNYITPSVIYKQDPETVVSSIFKKPAVLFNGDNYITEQVFYYSKDSTRIPMIITYRKGTELNGKNPAILYGYGGFSTSMTPSFSATTALWLEAGGIYAVPNIRGGGEYGEKWHLQGTKMNKQNVFDDFISAAEFLIQNKYTSTPYLAVMGRSNGGLLVGAVMTQRPDLFKVALPGVGVLDMLRYNKFTAGAGWAYDYGTAEESPEMFNYLLNYSPVHNVKEGTAYPATFITTGDHDDRVVPAHSFKFAANIQSKQSGNNPVLIRIETNAGHGAGTPVSKLIDQWVDIFSFTLWNMGIKDLDQ